MSKNIRIGEYGRQFIFESKKDITGDVSIQLRPPKVSYKDVLTYPAIVGDAPLNTTDVGVLDAYKYAFFMTVEGDIDVDGTWYARAISIEPNRQRYTKWIPFKVVK